MRSGDPLSTDSISCWSSHRVSHTPHNPPPSQLGDLIRNNIHKRIDRIPLRIIELHHLLLAVLALPIHRQAPLLRNKVPAPAPPLTPQPNLALPLGPLHPKLDINAPMHLVDLAPYPRVLAREVYFVAELSAHGGVRTQRVEGRRYDGGFLHLVVEEGEGCERHAYEEDGEGAEELSRDQGGHTRWGVSGGVDGSVVRDCDGRRTVGALGLVASPLTARRLLAAV